MPNKTLRHIPVITGVVFILLVARAWGNTWDDSAITLAFARNLAKYGDIVSTPLTGRVEGYSTFLWMFIHAVFFRLGLNTETVLILAKGLATLLALGNLYIFWQLLLRFLHTPLYQAIALSVFVFSVLTVSSATDGMETSLYAFLVLAGFYSYLNRQTSRAAKIAFLVTTSLTILVRHEGPLFLLPYVALALLENPKTFFRQPHFYVWGLVFLLYHSWHFLTFGEILTNPMLAKRHWPYTPATTDPLVWLVFRLYPLIDLVQTYRFPVIFAITFILFKKVRGENPEPRQRQDITLVNLFALTSLLVALLVGANFMAAPRLSYPGHAFLLLTLFSMFDDLALIQRSRFLQGALVLALIAQLATTLPALSASLPREISLEGVEELAATVSAVQAASRAGKITYAGSDMGGLLLYHGEDKRVIDLGLLCDRELAKNGYTHYESYIFEQEKPEIIEAHAMWLEPLLKSPHFFKLYQPVLVKTPRREQVLYLRNDFIEQLRQQHPLDRVSTNIDTPQSVTEQALKQFGFYLLLDLRGLTP